MGEAVRRASLLAVVGFALGACSGGSGPVGVSHLTPHPTYKIGAPYTINGVTYYPNVDYGYDEVGAASWYGGAFQGQYTANGEIFDLNQIGARRLKEVQRRLRVTIDVLRKIGNS